MHKPVAMHFYIADLLPALILFPILWIIKSWSFAATGCLCIVAIVVTHNIVRVLDMILENQNELKDSVDKLMEKEEDGI